MSCPSWSPTNVRNMFRKPPTTVHPHKCGEYRYMMNEQRLSVKPLTTYTDYELGVLGAVMRNIFLRIVLRLGRWFHIEFDYKSSGDHTDEPVETEMD